MECYKHEAIRAQKIAEMKFKDMDITGAKKFALKAQNLYPSLEGISQMLSTFDVHIAAEIRVAGEMDWYGVLGITPTVDDDTVRKQYRKLVLLVHPDKNKSVGADGAFRLISEAYSLLSDKAKRLAYNQRRSSIELKQRVQTQPQRSYSASNSNGGVNSTNSVPSKPETQRNCNQQQKNVVPPPPLQRTDTFWTICSHCKLWYEYLKTYLNTSLRCPSCRNVFMAIEVMPPLAPHYPFSQRVIQNLRNHAPSSNSGRNTVGTEKIRKGGSTGPNSSKHTYFLRSANPMAGNDKAGTFVAAQASNVYQQEKSRLKRERGESQGSALKGEASSKRRML